MLAEQFYPKAQGTKNAQGMIGGNQNRTHPRDAVKTEIPVALVSTETRIETSKRAAASLELFEAVKPASKEAGTKEGRNKHPTQASKLAALEQAAPIQAPNQVPDQGLVHKAPKQAPTKAIKQEFILPGIQGQTDPVSLVQPPAVPHVGHQADPKCEPNAERDQDDPNQPRNDFACSLCQSPFHTNESLQLHLDSTHNKTLWLKSAYKKAGNGKGLGKKRLDLTPI